MVNSSGKKKRSNAIRAVLVVLMLARVGAFLPSHCIFKPAARLMAPLQLRGSAALSPAAGRSRLRLRTSATQRLPWEQPGGTLCAVTVMRGVCVCVCVCVCVYDVQGLVCLCCAGVCV